MAFMKSNELASMCVKYLKNINRKYRNQMNPFVKRPVENYLISTFTPKK